MKNIILNGVENPYYYITRDGEVYNKEGKQLTLFKMNNGYLRVKLSRGCKRGMYTVHRLVAMTYIPNLNNLPIINHKDSNRSNNHVSNLEWCNNSYNQIQRFKNNPLNGCEKSIEQLDFDGNIIACYPSMKVAGYTTGIARQNISKVCRGLRNHAGGYFWRYTESRV